ncbi:MAG TPA: hypothetical protein VM144_10655 [Aestuariivirga sp.]|nr:hypothetical protein [Aestuariivirga sp.]
MHYNFKTHFEGTSLPPVPRVSKGKYSRYFNIYEDDQLGEAQFAALDDASQPMARRKYD